MCPGVRLLLLLNAFFEFHKHYAAFRTLRARSSSFSLITFLLSAGSLTLTADSLVCLRVRGLAWPQPLAPAQSQLTAFVVISLPRASEASERLREWPNEAYA